jgi:hypothetical protein
MRFQRFLRFVELFSLRKISRICPQHRGSGPPAPAHGSMDFIKCQSLVTRSMAQIKPIEPIRRLAPAGGGAGLHSLVTSATARQSLSFLELWWSVFDEVCSYGITTTRGTCLC